MGEEIDTASNEWVELTLNEIDSLPPWQQLGLLKKIRELSQSASYSYQGELESQFEQGSEESSTPS